MAKKQEMVPFKKIKKGGFFRMKGKRCLMQRGRVDNDNIGQMVTGKNVGHVRYFGDINNFNDFNADILVIPVNAKIVEEK